MAPENEFKKTWTKPILDGEAAGLILRLEPTDKKDSKTRSKIHLASNG